MPVAGGVPTDLHLKGTSPAWGPKRIAYIGNADHRRCTPHLAHGRARRERPARPRQFGALASPAWSPSGELAALVGTSHTQVVEVVNGTTKRVQLPFAQVATLAWSPDGTRLLVTARGAVTGPFDLYSVRPDGSGAQRLTTDLDALGAS